jgi:hypothetical protein
MQRRRAVDAAVDSSVRSVLGPVEDLKDLAERATGSGIVPQSRTSRPCPAQSESALACGRFSRVQEPGCANATAARGRAREVVGPESISTADAPLHVRSGSTTERQRTT